MTTSKNSAQASAMIFRPAMTDTPVPENSGLVLEPLRDQGANTSILTEVDFKWLMAGQGWWIDTTRFHSDRAYAARFLSTAMNSKSMVLRQCAASLQAEIGGLRV